MVYMILMIKLVFFVWRIIDINLIRKFILLLIVTADFCISVQGARRITLDIIFITKDSRFRF